MREKMILHSILLVSSVFLIFLWVTTAQLAYFNLQLTAILMIILVISRFLIKPMSFRLVESIISTMAVLLVIADTGGMSSPVFFLTFFLLFELSLLLEPAIPLVLSAALIAFYALTQAGGDLSSYAILLSFPFMTPLAVFLGQTYKKEENQKHELSNLNKKVRMLESLKAN